MSMSKKSFCVKNILFKVYKNKDLFIYIKLVKELTIDKIYYLILATILIIICTIIIN